jgi:hypothetical protein
MQRSVARGVSRELCAARPAPTPNDIGLATGIERGVERNLGDDSRLSARPSRVAGCPTPVQHLPPVRLAPRVLPRGIPRDRSRDGHERRLGRPTFSDATYAAQSWRPSYALAARKASAVAKLHPLAALSRRQPWLCLMPPGRRRLGSIPGSISLSHNDVGGWDTCGTVRPRNGEQSG